MNPDRTLNEGVMNEQSSLKLLWEVPYLTRHYKILCNIALLHVYAQSIVIFTLASTYVVV
jgi:hypothetical protein